MELRTWGGQSHFEYVGSIESGTKITYGMNNKYNTSDPSHPSRGGRFSAPLILKRYVLNETA